MPKKNPIDLSELGTSGLKRYATHVDEEFLKELSQSRAQKIYREMRDNDPTVGALLFAIEMLIRQVEWRVESVADSDIDRRASEFIEECLDDMSMTFQDVLCEILSMLVYGFSVHEIVYKQRLGKNGASPFRSKYSDGLIGWRKLPIRSQDTITDWVFDDEGGLQGIIQQAPPKFSRVFIPIERLLLFRTTTHKNNPEGRSILRNAYRPWFFKKRIEELEAIGVERDLAGLPIIWAPSSLLRTNATPEEKLTLNKLKHIVMNIRRDEQEGIVFPLVFDENGNKLYDITLLSTGSRRQFDTTQIISRYDNAILMSVLADFIKLGHEKVGSFALASSKTHIFSKAIAAWCSSIAEVFNLYAIPRLLNLNGFNVKDTPKLVYGDIETVDLNELASFVSSLAQSGFIMPPEPELEEYLRDVAGLPHRLEKEDFVLTKDDDI